MKVSIIGLGLMGGSLGLCLRENKFINKVSGFDKDKKKRKRSSKFRACR